MACRVILNRDEIRRRYQSGESVPLLAAEFGVSPATIYRRLDGLFTPDLTRRALATSLESQGTSYNLIGLRLGVTRQRAWAICRSAKAD